MNGRLGILVGGGPAPGINSAISACVIEAAKHGLQTIGVRDGFSHLMDAPSGGALIERGHAEPLTPADVAHIHSEGGSILRTSRANPTGDPRRLDAAVGALKDMGVSMLASIGGEDTALSASEVARASGGAIRVAHIPKTIDNDLPLPGEIPTFGFQTARHLGVDLVQNLMSDSRSTNRWYVVVVMGRKAGHLALGIGKAAAAPLIVIPEEFAAPVIRVDDVVRLIEGAMLKRKAMEGREDGVAVISEGVAERFNLDELTGLAGVEIARDPHGHMRLGELPLASVIRRAAQRRFADDGRDVVMVDATIGYELRCAPPIPFDIEYTRILGYGAARLLIEPPDDPALADGGLVYMRGEAISVMPFAEMRDPDTGRTRVRMVDIKSQRYRAARRYTARIEPEDLQDEQTLAKLARCAGKAPDEIRRRFGPAD